MRQAVALLGWLAVFSGGAMIGQVRAGTAEEGALSQIEAHARELTEQGARPEAVYILQRALETYRDTPDRRRIEADIRQFSLEGRPALPLQAGVAVGPRVPAMKELDGKVVFLFFWAHWCADCKAESSIVAALVEKYRAHGLVFVAPTQRYGYVSGDRPASPDRELRYIVHVRDTSYAFMRKESVPVTDANYKQYGVASIPMHVLIDRTGVIRLYQPGRITAEELDGAIRKLLAGSHSLSRGFQNGGSSSKFPYALAAHSEGDTIRAFIGTLMHANEIRGSDRNRPTCAIISTRPLANR